MSGSNQPSDDAPHRRSRTKQERCPRSESSLASNHASGRDGSQPPQLAPEEELPGSYSCLRSGTKRERHPRSKSSPARKHAKVLDGSSRPQPAPEKEPPGSGEGDLPVSPPDLRPHYRLQPGREGGSCSRNASDGSSQLQPETESIVSGRHRGRRVEPPSPRPRRRLRTTMKGGRHSERKASSSHMRVRVSNRCLRRQPVKKRGSSRRDAKRSQELERARAAVDEAAAVANEAHRKSTQAQAASEAAWDALSAAEASGDPAEVARRHHVAIVRWGRAAKASVRVVVMSSKALAACTVLLMEEMGRCRRVRLAELAHEAEVLGQAIPAQGDAMMHTIDQLVDSLTGPQPVAG